MRRGRATASIPYGDGDSWRRHHLAHFLQQKSTPSQQITASASQHSKIKVTLIDDLLFKILILLPAQSLFKLQFVCKKWFDMINSPFFITCHANQSQALLICRKLTLSEPHDHQSNSIRSYFHFMDLDRGGNTFIQSSSVELYDILASRDGLILARFGKYKKLMIVNPITRKQVVLPRLNCGAVAQESFGISFSQEAKTYKVVQLFFKAESPIGPTTMCTGCNILCISTRKWRRIEGPPYEVFRDMWDYVPITVGESMYWTRRPCSYYLSLSVKEEKFVAKNFPMRCSGYWDQLVEMEGKLGLVHHAQVDELQVWVLMDEGGSRENWVKRCSFSFDVITRDLTYYAPICTRMSGKEVVIESPGGDLHVYNIEREEIRMVHSRSDKEAWGGWVQKHHLPYRNTLVSCT